MMSRRIIVAASCVIQAGAASAEPARIVLDGCPIWGDELRFKIAAELASLATERGTSLVGRTIVVVCPDAVTAQLRIEPAPADHPLTKRLELGDVPDALRVRLIALATAELADVASRIALPLAASRSLAAVTAPADLHDRAPRSPRRSPAVLDAARPDGLALRARGGARAYARGSGAWMVDVAADATLGPYALGVFAATGTADDPLGRMRGWIAGVAADASLACVGDRFDLCAHVRGEAGVAVVTARSSVMDVTATTGRAPYGSVAGELVAAYPLGRWAVVAVGGVGVARGLVAHAGDRAPLELDGMFATGSVGVRWLP